MDQAASSYQSLLRHLREHTLKTQVFNAHGEKKIAQTVVDALTLRQTVVQALLARAQTSAASAMGSSATSCR